MQKMKNARICVNTLLLATVNNAATCGTKMSQLKEIMYANDLVLKMNRKLIAEKMQELKGKKHLRVNGRKKI